MMREIVATLKAVGLLCSASIMLNLMFGDVSLVRCCRVAAGCAGGGYSGSKVSEENE
jgi:hypothetical protein